MPVLFPCGIFIWRNTLVTLLETRAGMLLEEIEMCPVQGGHCPVAGMVVTFAL